MNRLTVAGAETGAAVFIDDLQSLLSTGDVIRGDYLKIHTNPQRWHLVDDMQGARNRQVLMTDKGNNAPALCFQIKATGWHSIHIGYYSKGFHGDLNIDAGLHVRITGERHFTRLCPERTEPTYAEAYYKTVNCDGELTIEIASFGLRSGLDYIRLTPVEPKKLPKPTGRSIAICDFVTCVKKNQPAGFEAGSCVRQHYDAGFDAILWKALKVRCEWHTSVGTPREMGVDYDTFGQAAQEAQSLDMPFYAWMRFNNEESNPKSLFNDSTPIHQAHPEARQMRKDGHLSPRTGFAHPEVRQFKVDLVREIVTNYPITGVCVDVLRHPPAVDFDLPMVEAYIQEYDEDPRQTPGDGSERWLKFKSQAFTQFLRDCRTVLDEVSEQSGRKLELIVRTMDQPWRNQQAGCDVQTWLDEEITDGLIFAAHLPSAHFYPQKIDMNPWLTMAAGRIPVYGQAWNCGSVIEAEAIAADMYDQGAAGIAIYESEYGIARPTLRENIWRFSRPGSLRYRQLH